MSSPLATARKSRSSVFSHLFRGRLKIVCGFVIIAVIYLASQAIRDISGATIEPVVKAAEPTQSALELTPMVDYDHPVAPTRMSHTVQYGDTLGSILTNFDISKDDINRLITCNGECRELHKLKPGTVLEITTDPNHALIHVDKVEGPWLSKRFHFLSDTIKAEVTHIEKRRVPVFGHVVIEQGESPIRAADRAANIREATVFRATQILEYDIDFWRNIRPDDWFEIYFEQVYVGDTYVDDGDILALRFSNRGAIFEAYRHSDGMHYSADGSAIQKQFLKAPLRYKRISSNFANARKHPIYGYTRAHRGVDYAAPIGTPVRSTADGVIRKVRRMDSQAGNFLVVSHAGGFETRYLHLNGFAPGIVQGVSVSRGTTIGYVGSTGVSTGPHLHYEIIKNGRHRDPLKVPNPTILSLEGVQKQMFLSNVAALNAQMARLKMAEPATEQLAFSR